MEAPVMAALIGAGVAGLVHLVVFGLTMLRDARKDRAAARAQRLVEARTVAGEVSDAIAANQVAIMHLRAAAMAAQTPTPSALQAPVDQLGEAQRQLVAASFRLRATAPTTFVDPLDVFLREAEVLAGLVPRVADQTLSDDDWDAALSRWGRAHLAFANAIRTAAFGDAS